MLQIENTILQLFTFNNIPLYKIVIAFILLFLYHTKGTFIQIMQWTGILHESLNKFEISSSISKYNRKI
jgi:hypothetical protein